MATDVAGGGADGFADADLTGAFGDGDEHDVHHADAAEGEGEGGDGSEEEGHDGEDALGKLRAAEGVPDGDGFDVVGLVVVTLGEDVPDLEEGLLVEVGRDGLDDDVADHALDDAGLLRQWHVAGHGGEGNEELGVVGAAAVAAVLLLLFEDADDGVVVAVDHEGLADDGLAGIELAVGVGAEQDDALAVGLVLGAHEAALLDLEGAEALVLGPDSADGTAGGIPLADLGDGAAQLGADRFDEVGAVTDGDGVADSEADVASSGVASGLGAGLAAEEDGDVSANAAEALLLIEIEADAEADEHDDRCNAPDDAEHGEEAAEFVLPERGQGLFEYLEKRHRYRVPAVGITRKPTENDTARVP